MMHTVPLKVRNHQFTFAEIWCLIKKRNEIDKNKFHDEKQKNAKKKYGKALSNIFLWTDQTDPWCNVLQTSGRRKKNIGVTLSDERSLPDYSLAMLE